MFRIFGKGQKYPSTEEPPETPQEYVNQAYPSLDQPPLKYVDGNPPIEKGENLEHDEGETNKPNISQPAGQNSGRGLILSCNPSKPHENGSRFGAQKPQEGDATIDVPSETGDEIATINYGRIQGRPLVGHGTVPSTGQENQTEREQQDSVSFEILKSIVYGGLMEVIASLSIVASAAASDATTLNIIALTLANLIGGIFIIVHNLWDLRDDCYKENSSQQTNQEANNKYKELLGHLDHFPLHAAFVVFAFLVFGIIPPVAYGITFYETNDQDFTVVAVAVASLVCVGLLAIFKAYINRCSEFFGYVKTVVYYITTAVTASGVSYVAGNLVTRLLHELGLFDTSSGLAMSHLPDANPALAFY